MASKFLLRSLFGGEDGIGSRTSHSWPKTTESGYQQLLKIVEKVAGEQVYPMYTICTAAEESVLKLTSGETPQQKLAGFSSKPKPKIIVLRKLCLKHMFLVWLDEIDSRCSLLSPRAKLDIARNLYSRFSILDEINPTDGVKYYLKELTIAVARSCTKYSFDEIVLGLNSRDSTLVNRWNLSWLNSLPPGSLPDCDSIELSLRMKIKDELEARKESTDLTQILYVFETQPQHILPLIEIFLNALSNPHMRPEMPDILRNVVSFLSKSIMWDKLFPTDFSTQSVRTHPAWRFAHVFATTMTPQRLYEVLVHTLEEVLFGERGAFERAKGILLDAMDGVNEGRYTRYDHVFEAYDVIQQESSLPATPATSPSSSSSSSPSPILDAEEDGGKKKSESVNPMDVPSFKFREDVVAELKEGERKFCRWIEREALKPATPSLDVTLQTSDGRRALLPITTLRELFSLPTFAYDTEGYPVVANKRIRFHSYIGEILVLPFLQGLYQARAETIDCYLEIDEMFDSHIEALIDEARATGGAGRVGIRKKTSMIQRLHELVVKAIGMYSRQSTSRPIRSAFASLVTSGVRLGISSDKFLRTVERDVQMLRKNTNLMPDLGRELRKLALETPPNVVGPPSPYAELFLTNLRTIRWAVKAAMFAVSFDQVVVFLSAGLSVFLIEGLPMSDENRDIFNKNENFRKLVGCVLSAISESLEESLKEGLLQLIEKIEQYIYEDGDVRKPLALCLELLEISKPVLREGLKRVLQLDGHELYKAIISGASDVPCETTPSSNSYSSFSLSSSSPPSRSPPPSSSSSSFSSSSPFSAISAAFSSSSPK